MFVLTKVGSLSYSNKKGGITIKENNKSCLNGVKDNYCPYSGRLCDRAKEENTDVKNVCCIGCDIYAMYTLSKG